MRRFLIGCLLFSSCMAFSGENPDKKKAAYEFKQAFFKENITLKSNSFIESLNFIQSQQGSKKSLFLAGFFSAAVPGAGEFYAESYLKSGLFFVIEVASWVLNIQYNKKGDDQTKFYKDYANVHWSVVKYAKWIEKNLDNFVTDQDYRNQCKALFQGLYKTGSNPWDQVNWNNLNAIERIIGVNGVPNNGFSHSLPLYDEQQYYELIGKYPQFRQGWDEADPNDNIPYVNKDSLFAQFKWYSNERGKANDFYSVASTFASIIIVNHIVSALDAVLSAYLYNKAHISMSYQTIISPAGKMTVNPFLNIRINF